MLITLQYRPFYNAISTWLYCNQHAFTMKEFYTLRKPVIFHLQ